MADRASITDGDQLDLFDPPTIMLPPCGRMAGPCPAVIEAGQWRCLRCGCTAPIASAKRLMQELTSAPTQREARVILTEFYDRDGALTEEQTEHVADTILEKPDE